MSDRDNPQLEKEYLDAGAKGCPRCGAEFRRLQAPAWRIAPEGNVPDMHVPCACPRCDARWTEVYAITLVRAKISDDGKGNVASPHGQSPDPAAQ